MGFLDWLRGESTRPAQDHGLSGGGYSFFFGGTTSGRAVTERSAMQMTAVYSCVRILAEAIHGDTSRFDVFAKLPWYPFPGGRTFRVPYSVMGSWWYGVRDRLGV